MEREVIRFGKLIAVVKPLGESGLYRVRLTGMGNTFTGTIEAKSHAQAAVGLIEELVLATTDRDRFIQARMTEARKDAKNHREYQDMIDRMNEAVAYAESNRDLLENAVRAMDDQRARKLGVRR